MSELEEKLGSVLANPQLMQQIMDMAQSLGQSTPPPHSPPPQTQTPDTRDMDPAILGKLMSLAGSAGIDSQQKALLRALEPYLPRDRHQKLEKAMRAARLASAVTAIFPGGNIPFLTGR